MKIKHQFEVDNLAYSPSGDVVLFSDIRYIIMTEKTQKLLCAAFALRHPGACGCDEIR